MSSGAPHIPSWFELATHHSTVEQAVASADACRDFRDQDAYAAACADARSFVDACEAPPPAATSAPAEGTSPVAGTAPTEAVIIAPSGDATACADAVAFVSLCDQYSAASAAAEHHTACAAAIARHYKDHVEPIEPLLNTGGLLVLMTAVAVMASGALRKAGDDAVRPESRLGIRTFAELVVDNLRGFVESTMGHDGRKYVPFFGTLFLFIFINNLLGLVPGFNPPTQVISTNFAPAIVVFLMTHILGLREHGVAYLKHFLGPVIFLAPLMFVIEVLSHLVRPVSLSVRLFGNMTGDHTVIAVFTDLVPVVVPVLFLGLGTFVCFVQALVFTMLSMIYVSGAVAHDDH